MTVELNHASQDVKPFPLVCAETAIPCVSESPVSCICCKRGRGPGFYGSVSRRAAELQRNRTASPEVRRTSATLPPGHGEVGWWVGSSSPPPGRAMRRRPLLAIPLLACILAPHAAGQRALPLTRAERSDFRETSRYADVVAFLDSVGRA